MPDGKSKSIKVERDVTPDKGKPNPASCTPNERGCKPPNTWKRNKDWGEMLEHAATDPNP